MTNRSTRKPEYVLIRDSKPKKSTRYYYDADDDNDSQPIATTRRIARSKPTKERIRYIFTDESESDYRRPRVAESSDRGIKMRHTTTGEQVVLDEDNNVVKIIRSRRLPTPPIAEHQRLTIRSREPRTLYYESSDGHLIAHSPRNPSLTRAQHDFVYAEDEPTKILRKIIVDPRTGNRETVYEKQKPNKQAQQKYVVRKRTTKVPVDLNIQYEQQQQPQYVQVVQRRTEPKQEAPPPPPPPATTKYMIIRKKVDAEPVYTASASIPASENVRRIVYESPPKNSAPTYVYTTNGKYYK